MTSFRSYPQAARSGWMTLLVSVGLLGLTLLGCLWLSGVVADQLHERADAAAERIRARNDQYIASSELALQAAQGLFAGSGAVVESEYRVFVETLTRGHAGMRALNYVDGDMTVRWVAPLRGNERAVNLNLRHLEGEPAMRRAIASGGLSATDPIALKEGGRGFLLFAPIGRAGAAVLLVSDLDDYLRMLGAEADRGNMAIRLVDGAGRPIWELNRPQGAMVSRPLAVGDRVWMLQVGTVPHWLDHLPVYLAAAIGVSLWLAMLALIWSDVFAAGRLTREVAARTTELRASRDQLQVILDGVADGIVVLAPPDGKLLYINDAAVSHLGYSGQVRGEGSPFSERSAKLELRDEQGVPLAPGESPADWALRGVAVPGQVVRYRHVLTGQERVVVVRGNPILDEAGQVRFAVMILHDLTERVAMEGRLKEQLLELQALDRLKNDFLNVVTHELRTPLTSIRGFAEFLEDGIGGELSKEQAAFVRHIQANAEQLGALVDDLLDMARLEAGKFTLRCARVDVAALTREAVDSFRPQALEARLALSLAAPEAPVWGEVDPTRLRQVLGNLLSNALKFTPEGGAVTVSLTAAAGALTWQVADSGIGVEPEQVPRLFSKFFQVESALNRTYKGTGLGLAITKGLVEAHGGQIVLTSAPGRGTVVTVTIPAAVAQTEPEGADPSTVG